MKVFCLIILNLAVLIAEGHFNKTDIHEILFTGYNKDAIPKRNYTKPICVTFNLVLYSIHDVDEKNQKISFRAVLDIQWKDEILIWDPKQFGGVKSITVSTDRIWIPDIVLQDTFGSITDSVKTDGRAIIKYNGHVTIWPSDLYTVACKLSVRKFPFDRQTCKLDFLSWIPEDHTILEKREWYLQNIKVKNESIIFREENWDHVVFVLEIQRKSRFHIVNYLIPVILISILDVMCFVLPSESGERVALSVSILLTLTVFLSAVNNTLPESSDDVADFTVFIGLQILGSALSVILTNISLYLYFKSPQDPIPVLLLRFAKVCCFKTHCAKRSEITWQLVSRALDRICIVFAAIWHPVLLVSLVYAAYQ